MVNTFDIHWAWSLGWHLYVHEQYFTVNQMIISIKGRDSLGVKHKMAKKPGK